MHGHLDTERSPARRPLVPLPRVRNHRPRHHPLTEVPAMRDSIHPDHARSVPKPKPRWNLH
jgi:hypothetical protein